MHSQLDIIMSALGSDPAVFAIQLEVYATHVNTIPSNQHKLTQSLAKLEEYIRELEECARELKGSDEDFPSEEEDKVVHSISTGAFDLSVGSRSGGDEGLDFDGQD
ncbi:hypothetical protein SCP_1204130 [Sparassis crispa]|uniref:Uncharacterized protein n=1 Tax=Sparassis crispa TaxID=139825 RepID=A0A401H1B0_9APHY|nr:hypothetical protein SCP_1204130 [Sparassis crispa]GBE88182.1 hypothetical protein SCP_1204130 [Sparassis crispa]